MTQRRLLRIATAGCLLAWAGLTSAEPLSVANLQRLLQDAPKRELRFQETRESRWLESPAESSGTLRAGASVLEKKVEKPRRETWRILDDRMQLITPGASEVKEIVFSQAPALAALARALRSAVAGDLQTLAKDFRLVPAGDERLWTLQLMPRRPDISRHLKQLELQGTGHFLQVIVIVEAQGDRTTTRLIHEP